VTVPTLTPRAAREQGVFRTLLNAMARPGSVAHLELGGSNPLVAIAEALVDHEVTFAVAPERPELTEAILRQTGSHAGSIEASAYVFCEAASLELVLQEAADGIPEYPDAGATVICLAPAVSSTPGPGEPITVSGPGIRETATVFVDGFGPGARQAFAERNAMRPLGLDLVLVAAGGALVCFTRYTTFVDRQEGQEE
jgi:alpha-D-ribose 1-methylphosphonate 5-triphosphate synthase subunit PhnH